MKIPGIFKVIGKIVPAQEKPPDLGMFMMEKSGLPPVWCWASVAAAVINHYAGSKVTSACKIVEERAKGCKDKDCCAGTMKPCCQARGSTKLALGKHLVKPVQGKVKLKAIADAVDVGLPVVLIKVAGGGRHAVAVVDVDVDVDEILILDPNPSYADGYKLFSEVEKDQGDGKWISTIFTRKA